MIDYNLLELDKVIIIMVKLNISELFNIDNTLCVSTINPNKIITPKITIPKLKTFEYDKADIYNDDIYLKIPHHSYR